MDDDAELNPVGYADGRKIPQCPGPIYLRLAAAFRELVNQEIKKKDGFAEQAAVDSDKSLVVKWWEMLF